MIDQADRRGRRAFVYYRGGAQGEEAFDDLSTGQPAEILIGCGQVPPGVDELLFEMKVGEERVVTLPPEKAFGLHDPAGVQSYARLSIEGGDKLQTGDWMTWVNPASRRRIPVRVIAATQDTVTLDFNHPLAGKNLEYWINLIKIV
ncbi:MAG TPA: FKBP-type peptidyl-prolyl cis-trans isomerase [Syntrophomonas sp.]|jgi:FKBP-type peptidyl-prolyl cis-trans isomerase SlyD|nr:FKBP-type peptidyl-prolyl cis-trans isomerase [Syntrophomonas sp.]